MTVMSAGDYVALILYFIVVFGVGIGASCRAKTDSAQGYFLAGRNTHWIIIGASTYATNIGAPMFVGLAGTAAASGISVVMFEWHAVFMLVMLGWLFLPVYIASGCYTMPEYLRMRYGGQRIRIWLSIIMIFLTIISQIAGQMYAGALFLTKIFQWDLYTSVVLILALTALYTILGGLTAVMWTDTIQTAILLIGCSILAIISLIKIGGFNTLRYMYERSASTTTFHDVSMYGNRTCGLPRDDSFHIFRDAETGDYPWPGMIGGLTILALHAWCTDQICVQRSLSAKSMTHAKAGVLLAAYLKILPFFFFIIPGMVSRVLYPEEVGCSIPEECRRICGNPAGCSNIAYPLLVMRIMPDGARGIMLAALLSALMSSLTSIFNSGSTIFTMDIWRRLRRRATEAELMVVGRVFVIFLVIVGVLWLPILEKIQGSQFWNYTQAIGSYLLPPTVVVILMGLFWTRTTEQGAFWGLMFGFVVGVIRMGLSWARSPEPCGSTTPDYQFSIIARVHFMHFAVLLSVLSAIVMAAISIVTEPRPPQKLRRVTFWTKDDPLLPELTDSEPEDEVEHQDTQNTQDPPKKTSRVKQTLLKVFCGVDYWSKQHHVHITDEQKHTAKLTMTDIKEHPFWAKVLNINMVICVAVVVFLHGFWA